MKRSLLRPVAQILARPPFAGQTSTATCHANFDHQVDYAIAVPVRNEEQLLPRALKALVANMRASPAVGAIVFVVNDTEDRSASIIRSTLQFAGVNFATVELSLAQEIRNAPHARRLALDIGHWMAPDGVLLTTDADSRVGPNWLASRLLRIAERYDLVCEDVRLDEGELALLPAHVRAIENAEHEYFEVSNRLWRMWTRNRASSFAYRAFGASLAMRSEAYRAIGGLPTPPVGEDQALCKAMLEAQLRVVTSNDGETRTSARLHGRAKGGCGDCLAMRTTDKDPPCDPALVPISVLRERALNVHRLFSASACASVGHIFSTASHPPLTFSQVLAELNRARSAMNELATVHA